jgi:hypothetical protein
MKGSSNRYASRQGTSGAKTPSGRRTAATPTRRSRGGNQGATMANGCPPGQHLRGGKQIIAIGGPAPTTIAAAAQAVIQFQIPESGRLLRLVASTSTGDLFGLTLDALEHNNVNLTSGTIPLEMFADVTMAQTNPIIGRWVLVNDQVQASITNNTAAPIDITLAFSVA